MNHENPLILGIESSCDETGVGLVRGTELLANTVSSSMEEHIRFGGVIPEIASRAHLDAFVPTLQQALADASVSLQDVDATNGCMHFIDRGHLDGVLTHRLVEGMASDLLTCDVEVDERRTVVCPIKRGSVTFHHSKTPHMTTANTSKRWRKAVSNHMQAVGAGGEGGHYPWKIYVNQRTGETIIPEDRR